MVLVADLRGERSVRFWATRRVTASKMVDSKELMDSSNEPSGTLLQGKGVIMCYYFLTLYFRKGITC